MSNDKFKDTTFIDIKGLTHFFENIKETELLKYYLNDDINFATNDDILSIFNKNFEEPEIPEEPTNLDFYFIANKQSYITFSNDLEYSLNNGKTWNAYSANTVLNLNTNDVIGFRGELIPNKTDGIGSFKGEGDISVYGNPEVLLVDNILVDYAFGRLFGGFIGLTDASGLEFNTELKTYCYQYMFTGCINLNKVADLPATTPLSYCYQYMFENCISLVKAPEIFLNNRGIGTVIIMDNECADSAMTYMFAGCSNLNYIKCHMPALKFNLLLKTVYTAQNWVSGVSASGTFYKKSSANIETGNNGIPKGWEVIDF